MAARINRRIWIFGPLLILLSIPWIAMQFTPEVNWTPGDFTVMALLLLGLGFSVDLVLRKVSAPKGRMLFGLLILAIFLLIWAELAVGILGTPFAGS